MPFTVEEFRDHVRLLEQHPEWRVELRRWVMTEDLLMLPHMVGELAEAQYRTAELIGQLALRIDQLTQRVDQLAQRMDQLTHQVDCLVDVQLTMGADLERLKGSDLERRYRERAHVYFSRLVRRSHVLSGNELTVLLEGAVTRSQLSEEEADEIVQTDIVVRGRRREDGAEVHLVAEVSWEVGLSDVQRASQRAALLAKIGIPALPVVAGFWVSPEAREPAHSLKVWQVTDGQVTPPETSH